MGLALLTVALLVKALVLAIVLPGAWSLLALGPALAGVGCYLAIPVHRAPRD